jgi:hypothetical protein
MELVIDWTVTLVVVVAAVVMLGGQTRQAAPSPVVVKADEP